VTDGIDMYNPANGYTFNPYATLQALYSLQGEPAKVDRLSVVDVVFLLLSSSHVRDRLAR